MRLPLRFILFGALFGFVGCKPRQEAKEDASIPAIVDAAKPSCVELSERMCAHFGKSSEMCAFVERQTQRFRDGFCQGKLEKFEENVAELSKYQEAKQLVAAPTQKSWSLDAPALGSPDAPVVLTVFCDFDALDCGRLAPLHNVVKNLHGDRVRLVFRQYPLVKNPDARLAAEASLAAHAQGKFWEYHDTIFANPQDHTRKALERYAKTVGLNLPEFKKALDDHTYCADVDADKELGQSLFISELPAVFANGRSVQAPYGAAELAQVFDEALAKSKLKP